MDGAWLAVAPVHAPPPRPKRSDTSPARPPADHAATSAEPPRPAKKSRREVARSIIDFAAMDDDPDDSFPQVAEEPIHEPPASAASPQITPPNDFADEPPPTTGVNVTRVALAGTAAMSMTALALAAFAALAVVALVVVTLL